LIEEELECEIVGHQNKKDYKELEEEEFE